MGTSKKMGVEAQAGSDGVGLSYLSEIKQEVITLDDNDFKIIPHPDGLGYTIATRRKDLITIVTRMFIKDGFLKRSLRITNDVLERKKDGWYQNGRKL
jgi:hypothetical protein